MVCGGGAIPHPQCLCTASCSELPGAWILALRFALQAGANPDGDPHCLCTPLYVAAMDGNLPVLQVRRSDLTGSVMRLVFRPSATKSGRPYGVTSVSSLSSCRTTPTPLWADPTPSVM